MSRTGFPNYPMITLIANLTHQEQALKEAIKKLDPCSIQSITITGGKGYVQLDQNMHTGGNLVTIGQLIKISLEEELQQIQERLTGFEKMLTPKGATIGYEIQVVGESGSTPIEVSKELAEQALQWQCSPHI